MIDPVEHDGMVEDDFDEVQFWRERAEKAEAELVEYKGYLDRANTKLWNLATENTTLEANLAELKSKTYCAYCGDELAIRSDMRCEDHPWVNAKTMWGCPDCIVFLRHEKGHLEAERDRLKKEIGELATGHLEAQHRAAKENARLREAECLQCGKSLPPDGDCYACVNDRLMTVLNEIAFNNDCDPRAEARHALAGGSSEMEPPCPYERNFGIDLAGEHGEEKP